MFDLRLVTVISDIFCSSAHKQLVSFDAYSSFFLCNYRNVDNHTERVVRSFVRSFIVPLTHSLFVICGEEYGI